MWIVDSYSLLLHERKTGQSLTEVGKDLVGRHDAWLQNKGKSITSYYKSLKTDLDHESFSNNTK